MDKQQKRISKLKSYLKNHERVGCENISWNGNDEIVARILDEFEFNAVNLNEIYLGAPKLEIGLKNESPLELILSFSTTNKFSKENLEEIEEQCKEIGVVSALEKAFEKGILEEENGFCAINNIPKSGQELAQFAEKYPNTVSVLANTYGNSINFKGKLQDMKEKIAPIVSDAVALTFEAGAIYHIYTNPSLSNTGKLLSTLACSALSIVACAAFNKAIEK